MRRVMIGLVGLVVLSACIGSEELLVNPAGAWSVGVSRQPAPTGDCFALQPVGELVYSRLFTITVANGTWNVTSDFYSETVTYTITPVDYLSCTTDECAPHIVEGTSDTITDINGVVTVYSTYADYRLRLDVDGSVSGNMTMSVAQNGVPLCNEVLDLSGARL